MSEPNPGEAARVAESGVAGFTSHVCAVRCAVLALAIVLTAASTVLAQDEQAATGVSAGLHEFQRSCAACHGEDATGHGPQASELASSPSDLTRLSRDNDGVFPFDHVFSTIDGRELVGSHGPRAMPVWGDRFQVTGAGYSEPGGDYVVLGRILALARYLQSIQTE